MEEEILIKYNFLINDIEESLKASSSLNYQAFILATDDQKKRYIAKMDIGYSALGPKAFSFCNNDIKQLYLERLLTGNRKFTLNNELFDLLTDELKNYYLSMIVPDKEYSLTSVQFDYASDFYKIEYIMYRGMDKVDAKIKEWFPKWKLIKGRDHRIDKILLD